MRDIVDYIDKMDDLDSLILVANKKMSLCSGISMIVFMITIIIYFGNLYK